VDADGLSDSPAAMALVDSFGSSRLLIVSRTGKGSGLTAIRTDRTTLRRGVMSIVWLGGVGKSYSLSSLAERSVSWVCAGATLAECVVLGCTTLSTGSTLSTEAVATSERNLALSE